MGELCAEELVVQVGLAIWRGMVVGRGAPWGHANRRGAVHRCLTLQWVVRNIPQKIGTILINGLV